MRDPRRHRPTARNDGPRGDRGLPPNGRGGGRITELLDVLWESARNSTARVAAPGSTSQLRLMYLMDREGGIRMRTVCHLLAASPPSVSRMCDRLQAIGFIERMPCPDSGREVCCG